MRELLVLVCVLSGCDRGEPSQPPPAAVTQTTPAEPEPVTKTTPAPTPCLARYSFDSDSSVLDEQRRRGGAARWDDFARRYDAAYLDPDSDHPVEVVESFRIGDTPLLWFRADFSEAVVNAAVLGPLKVVDGTRIRVGERETIGALTELGLGKIGGRELAHFLLRADVVHTYVHIGSSVCLVEESTGPDGSYRGRFSGEHTYFTNEEMVDRFGFWLELDAEGQLSIEGAQALLLPAATRSANTDSR